MNVPKLRFPEFDENWKISQIKNVLELLTDYEANGSFSSLRENTQTYDEENYAWFVRATDLENNNNPENSNDIKYIDKASYKFLSKTQVVKDDFLVTKRGEIGKVYLMPKSSIKTSLAPNMYLFKLNTNKIINRFIYCYFLSGLGSSSLRRLNSSTTMGALYKDDVKSIKLFLPEIPEQQKIASFLSKVDEKIEKLEKKQKLSENYKKGIMQQIFSQKLRFKDENGEDYPDWKEKKFNQIFNFIPSNSFSRENLNYETGNVYNIHYGDIHTKYPVHLDFENAEVPFINDNVNLERIKSESYCKDGDLVIVDASEDYEDIGKAIELKNIGNKNVLAGLHTFLVRDKAGHTKSGYRSFMLLDDSVKLQIKKLATGVSVLGISKSNLGSVRLMVPSLQEQSKIAGFLSSIGSKIEQLNKEIKMNKEFKKGLLQQMFC